MNMHSRMTSTAVLAVGLVIGLAEIASAQPVTLRYKWTKGEDVRYRVIQQSTGTVSGLPGGMGNMNIESTMTQVFRSLVQDVAADGTATIKQVIESVRMEANTPMAKMVFDSANKDAAATPDANPMNSAFAAMVGEYFIIVVGPTGLVQKVEGMDRLMEKVFKTIPQNFASAAAVNAMKNSLTDESMKQTFSQSYVRFPDRPLQVGETWKNENTFSNPMFGQQTTSTASTLTAVEGQIAKVAIQLNVKFDPSASAANPMMMKMTPGESSGEGELLFDVAKGQYQRSTTRMTMAFSMSGSGPDGAALSMQTVSKSVVTVEIVQ
jgi:Family of unknown function (DUF6263)